jgi:hypothetical protein
MRALRWRHGSANVERKSRDGKPWGKPYEAYRCHTRICDKSACDQPPLARADVDEVALLNLEEQVVSVERTRDEIRQDIAFEREAVAARLQDASREERKAAEAFDRIERDYINGELSARSHDRLLPKVEGEMRPHAPSANRSNVAWPSYRPATVKSTERLPSASVTCASP